MSTCCLQWAAPSRKAKADINLLWSIGRRLVVERVPRSLHALFIDHFRTGFCQDLCLVFMQNRRGSNSRRLVTSLLVKQPLVGPLRHQTEPFATLEWRSFFLLLYWHRSGITNALYPSQTTISETISRERSSSARHMVFICLATAMLTWFSMSSNNNGTTQD